jgi:murein DD-endopeptidase MepM/ murein hydrolase activator NlpD
MTEHRRTMRLLYVGSALALAACTTDPSQLDWDLRPDSGLSTSEAARSVTASRPAPDSRGVISYPGYQVAVAERGDTVASVAARLGVPADALARANGLQPDTALNAGAVLTLPGRVSEPAGGPNPAPAAVAPIATTSLGDAPAGPAAAEPIRHKVVRGETAYSVARRYNVTTRSLAEWNGLGPDLAIREGQILLIPVVVEDRSTLAAPVTRPGSGSPTPEPPSAATPLPAENPAPASQPAPGTPASPDLGQQRTGASAAQMAMPVQGEIIRAYVPDRNEGIDIGAPAGTPVVAAADGTVATITKDTEQVPILILRHPDNLLTVYANVDGITLAKGDAVKRGQPIAVVRQGSPSFVHFEVRKGFDAVDPMPYVQ